MRFVSLFTGVGGMDLGLERAGWECVAQVENDEWCTRILNKHWPDVPKWSNIYDVTAEDLPHCDAIVGGFPCQPVSLAGRRQAQNDERWLWPEFLRIIRTIRPSIVLVENVSGLFSAGFGDVVGGLAEAGYDTEWASVPAAAVGAPHLRWRVFIVAYPRGTRSRRVDGVVGDVGDEEWGASEARGEDVRSVDWEAYSDGVSQGGTNVAYPDELGRDGWTGEQRPGGRRESTDSSQRSIESGMGRGFDGVSRWLDGTWEHRIGRTASGIPDRTNRLRGLGNAVVPQVAEWVGRRISNTIGAQDG